MSVDFLKTAAKALRLRLPGPNTPCHSHCRQLVAAGFGRKTAESTYPLDELFGLTRAPRGVTTTTPCYLLRPSFLIATPCSNAV